MTNIQKVDPEDFPKAIDTRLSAEAIAIRALKVGEALSMSCHWKHTGNRCHGGLMVRKAAQRVGQSVTAICRDKTLYVKRVA